MNIMTIKDYQAVIAFDPDIEVFRGEFVGLNGDADFYAADVKGLKKEGEASLRVFLEACERRGIEPHKYFSGKPSVDVPPGTLNSALKQAGLKE